MAMIKCPECQKEISETSTSCPNCGCPITSETSTLNQKTNIQAEIYKTAFIHSAIIVLEAFILPIWTWLLYNGNSLAFVNLGTYRNSFMLGILFSVLILIEILYIAKCKQNKSDLMLAYKCRTMFLMWSSYAIIYCVCFGCYVMEQYLWLGGNKYLLPSMINIAVVIMLIFVGIVLFANGADFKKYRIITIVWGIYALLLILITISIVYSSHQFSWQNEICFISAILTVPLSIAMGILWGVSSSKSKSIQ